MAKSRSQAGRRALVLGGGGSAGNAWLIGVVAGMDEAGLDATSADLFIGTSAGATAVAQLTGGSPSALLAAVLDPAPQNRPLARTDGRPKPGEDHLTRTGRIIAAAADAADMRRRMGAAAIELARASDPSERWRATVATRLPSPDWPEPKVLITAVDATTGEPVVFDRDSGVDLVDAVAASCSSGAAYSIGTGRYLDGGYRSNENADLAADCDEVLVIAPLGGRTRHPLAWGTNLAAQVESLRAGGVRVETILPDAGAVAAFGDDLMAPSVRRPAAEQGYRQGRAAASQLTGFWQAVTD